MTPAVPLSRLEGSAGQIPLRVTLSTLQPVSPGRLLRLATYVCRADFDSVAGADERRAPLLEVGCRLRCPLFRPELAL